MRLWSLHPHHLDAKGLVALWREALLAQKVLSGLTQGYRNHPQLTRFRQQADPLAAIATYLREVQLEATRRGYRFDAGKIADRTQLARIPVTDGQLAYELAHLRAKLKARDPAALARLDAVADVEPHPLFRVVEGDVAEWEIR
ncbi:MAG TPA: pyrimidine dimer DNA glycosylase/endonuclease V [Gallionellaceae bacterium]